LTEEKAYLRWRSNLVSKRITPLSFPQVTKKEGREELKSKQKKKVRNHPGSVSEIREEGEGTGHLFP